MKHRLTLLTAVIGFALVGVVGCQHATDTDAPGDDSTVTAEQAEEASVLLSTPNQDGTGYLHFGFHPEFGWKFFTLDKPADTVSIDKEFAKLGATTELKSGLRSAAQAQGQGQGPQGQPGGGNNGSNGSDSDPFGGFASGAGSGPQFSASAAMGTRFSAQSPGASRFSASNPGATSSGSVYSASPGTASRFSASASSGAGQVCSLRPLCDFSQAVCRVYPSAFSSSGSSSSSSSSLGCGSVSQCYQYINQASSQAQLNRRQLCVLSDLFTCASRTIRQVRPQVNSQKGGAFAVLGSLLVCFNRVGLSVPTSSSSSP